MRLKHLAVVGALVGLSAAPLAAQLRSNRPPTTNVNLPRLLVANPHSFSSQDSTASVRVGAGMREKIDKVAEKWHKTLTRSQMNEALQQYAYPVDAVLPPMVAKQLAQSLNARVMVVSTMLKGEGGRYAVEARLVGANDDAGQMVRLTQNPNESFEEFGGRIGEAFAGAFKALPDAKLCENLRQTATEKAIEAALKAIKNQPNSGLAHYCQARIMIDKKAPVDSVIVHLKVATQGDPLSLFAWNLLAVQYQAKGDSAATLETYKRLLRVAPTNEPLRKEAFGLFQRYGRPDAAEGVADEGIALDPVNADMWDLKFGACIAQERPEKNRCAVEALEHVFELDSTKADTTFFTKITYAASRSVRIDTVKLRADSTGTRPARDSVVSVIDTARFLKWSQRAVAKYPNNGILIGQKCQAFSVAQQVDSAVVCVKQLMTVDSSDVSPVLRVSQKLVGAKRARDVLSLTPYAERLGSDEDKLNLSLILTREGAFPLLQPPTDYVQAAELAREAMRLIPLDSAIKRLPPDSAGKLIPVSSPARAPWQLANYILGIATFLQIPPLDPEAERTKSCSIAEQMQVLLAEAGPALQAGRSINENVVARFVQGVEGFKPRINSMIKAYCK